MRRLLHAALLPLCLALILTGRPARAQAPERISAPELDGAVGTIGSDKPILLKNLRGKIVVLEFWTLC